MVVNGYELPCGCWEGNPSPLENSQHFGAFSHRTISPLSIFTHFYLFIDFEIGPDFIVLAGLELTEISLPLHAKLWN